MKTENRHKAFRFMEDDRDAGNEVIAKYELRFPKFIWASCAQLYSLAEAPQPPPPPIPPAFGLIYVRGSAKKNDISL
jgi:hypothetical protein